MNLYDILMTNDVVKSIKINENELLLLIPELENMFGFDQKHPHHHLDVWGHTLLALSKSPIDFNIRLSLLLHDIGKPFCYQDEEVRHFRGHPQKSVEISKIILTRNEIINSEYILQLIAEHDSSIESNKITQNPKFYKDLLIIQFCDTMAHNPQFISNRLSYIKSILNEYISCDWLNNQFLDIINKEIWQKKHHLIVVLYLRNNSVTIKQLCLFILFRLVYILL